jgi:ABC-type Mn2+/Zn2+ transport system ATPase subunit
MTLQNALHNANTLFRHGAAHDAHSPILRVENLSVRYNGAAVLQEISFELQAGERVSVVGPNGAGKSTLFKAIAGVIRPTAGAIQVSGYEPGGHICIAYLPQRSQVDWQFPVSVADVVMMGRIGKLGLLRNPAAHDWDKVRQSLQVVNLEGVARRQIGELSGGQQQRMFIARALAQEAELMLMDEPLTGLDLTSQDDIFRILEDLRQQRITVMVALHDLKIAAEHFDRAMLLNRQMVGWGRPAEVFTPERLISAYGGHLNLVATPQGTLAVGDTCCDEGEDHAH